MSEKAFFLGDEDELASAIERFCSVGRERAQGMARIVADIASLPEDENKDVAEAIAELRGASERPFPDFFWLVEIVLPLPFDVPFPSQRRHGCLFSDDR